MASRGAARGLGDGDLGCDGEEPVAARRAHCDLGGCGPLDDPPTLLSGLGLAESTPMRVGQLPDAIFALLRVDHLGEDASSVLELVSNPDWLAGQREEVPEAALFAEYLAFAEVVPFEQSKQKAAALATTGRMSYSPAGQVAGFSGFSGLAPVLIVPHVAVAYLAVVSGVAGGLVVVDSIGVITGVASGPKTAGARAAVGRGLRRLLHRPDQPEPDNAKQDTSDQPSQSAAPETPVQKAEASDEDEVTKQDDTAESKRNFLQKMGRRRRPKILP